MKWVLTDLSYLAHRARHAFKGLEFEDAKTGVTFGFFESLRTICFDPRIQSNKVALFFDSRQSYRRRLFPDYKRSRMDRTPEEMAELIIMHEQISRLKNEILPDVGFPLFKQIGLESDDLLASAAKFVAGGVLVTADNDLFQCITDTVHWFDPQRDLYLTPTTFLELKGVTPFQWKAVKAICGCHGDGVPGIGGVGEKGAIDFLTGKMPQTSKKFLKITSPETAPILARNGELTSLPHPKTGPIHLTPPTYHPERFFKWAKKLGFESMLEKNRNSWERFFEGKMIVGPVPRRRGE